MVTLPPNVSIYPACHRNPSNGESLNNSTLLQARIFSRLVITQEPSNLAAALIATPAVDDRQFCFRHQHNLLIFDDDQDVHHEHVRIACLMLRDFDLSIEVSGCIFDVGSAPEAGFQLEGLSGGSVMVVDLKHDEDSSDSDSDSDSDLDESLIGVDNSARVVAE